MQTLYERLVNSEARAKQYDDGVQLQLDKDFFVGVLQRQVFEDFSDNPVLQHAIAGEYTLETKLSDLDIDKGIRKFFPHFKDENHNQDLRSMDRLVGTTMIRNAHGFFFPDNVASWVGYSAILPLTLDGFGVMIGTLMAVRYSIDGFISQGTFVKKPLVNEAKFIDNKIFDLGLSKKAIGYSI